jgi:hypothetical protein
MPIKEWAGVWLRAVAVVNRFAPNRDEAVVSRCIRYPHTSRLREAVFGEKRSLVEGRRPSVHSSPYSRLFIAGFSRAHRSVASSYALAVD